VCSQRQSAPTVQTQRLANLLVPLAQVCPDVQSTLIRLR
jgi:hypothetical protein